MRILAFGAFGVVYLANAPGSDDARVQHECAKIVVKVLDADSHLDCARGLLWRPSLERPENPGLRKHYFAFAYFLQRSEYHVVNVRATARAWRVDGLVRP